MSEFTLTIAENGYLLECEDEPVLKLVYEETGMPYKMMKEILCDLEQEIENGESDKIKITINVDKL